MAEEQQGGGIFQRLFRQIVNAENLVLLRKSDRLAILAAGLVVVAALGAIATMPGEPVIKLVLSVASMLIVAGLVGLVHFRSLSYGDEEADLQIQAEAAQAVNGEWWQLVPAEDHPGLSYVSIALSEISERHAIHGISFDENGTRRARFSSDVVAVRTSYPVEIYYFWRGTKISEADAKIVSGLGRFRFDSVGNEKRPKEAEGMFTRGTPVELRYGKPRTVELFRLSDSDSAKLKNDPSCLSELAVEAFKHYKLKPGRSLSEARGQNRAPRGALTGPKKRARRNS
jgi:hypothetical protein